MLASTVSFILGAYFECAAFWPVFWGGIILTFESWHPGAFQHCPAE